MAQEILVTDALTREMIDAGAKLLTLIDNANLNARAALWLYLSDSASWRLCFAITEVKKLGPKAIYMKISSIEKKLPQNAQRISIKDIEVMEEKAPLISTLRQAISTSPGINNIRFTRNWINGTFIEDAHIYRLI